MIEFVLGRAASGKSSYLQEQIARLDTPVCLIVPEQESMQAERAMQQRFGDRVKVLSFHRLCDELMRAYGGGARARIGQVAKAGILYRAVAAVRPKLQFYRKSARDVRFLGKIGAVMDDFSAYRADSAVILPLFEGTPAYARYHDLFLIYDSYKALLAQDYRDSFDDLDSAYRILKEHDFFAGYTVMLDSFTGFTGQEYLLLEQILIQSEHVYVTLTADENDRRLFAAALSHLRRLCALVDRYGLKWRKQVLAGNYRAQTDGLRALESGGKVPADGSVRVFSATDTQREVTFVAQDIRRKVLSGQCRYRDIALASNVAPSYQHIVETVFARFDIPLHTDRKVDVRAKPLFSLILHAFDAVQYGYRYEDMISLAKTNLCGMDYEEVARLENYVFMWNIRGAKWEMEWTQSPFGLEEGDPEQKAARLAALNASRLKLITPLVRFKEDTRTDKARDLLRAVWELTEQFDAAAHIRALARACEQPAEREQWIRLYDLYLEFLDQMALVLGDTEITRRELHDLMEACLQEYRFGVLPAYMDQTALYDMVRSRPSEVKYLYILGAGQGQLPAVVQGGNIITDRDIRYLSERDITLSKDSVTVALEQHLCIYRTLSAAREEITFTFPEFTTDGQAVGMAPMIGELGVAVQKAPAALTHPREVLDFIAGLPASHPMRAQYAPLVQERFGVSLEALRPKSDADETLPRELVEALYGRELSASQTRLECFVGCPFQFFLKYGLKLSEDTPVTFSMDHIGSFVHAGMEQLINAVRESGDLSAWDDGRIERFLEEKADAYLAGELHDMDSPRFAHLFSRMRRALLLAGKSAVDELRHSRFFPLLAEYHFEKRIPLADGFAARVNGYIDRVDAAALDGENYLKIIDYKTGKKDFSLAKIYNGYNLQLPLYASMLLDEPDYRGMKLAGMEYFLSGVPEFSEKPTDTLTLAEQFKRKGLFLADRSVITALDDSGSYTNVRIKNDGDFHADAPVADAAQLEALGTFVLDKTKEIVGRIAAGETAVRPMKKGVNGCEYCKFDGICRFEYGRHKICAYRSIKPAAFFEEITRKGEDD